VTTQQPPTAPGLECETVQEALIERMLDGERLAGDPALAEHVGSCLRCFRMAGDLRGLPRLREQMRAANSEPDPGAAFWNGFPEQVAAAWAATRTAGAEAVPARTRTASLATRTRAAFAQLRAWLQMPVPAACAGALGAAVLVVLATRAPSGERPGIPVGEIAGVVAGTPALRESEVSASLNAGGLVLGGGIDDSIKDLGVEELRRLRRGLEQTMASEAMDRASATVAAGALTVPGGFLIEGQAESRTTAISEELDELDDNGLAVLAENLGGPI
jgi:hypothetical protein